jgi:hypothetical protein
MSIRTTVTLDEDVVERLNAESRSRGISFHDAANDLLRSALGVPVDHSPPETKPAVKSLHMGYHPCLELANTEKMLECIEGEDYK